MLKDAVGPCIAMLKTHADVVAEQDVRTGADLQVLAARHNFLVFEARKYAYNSRYSALTSRRPASAAN